MKPRIVTRSCCYVLAFWCVASTVDAQSETAPVVTTTSTDEELPNRPSLNAIDRQRKFAEENLMETYCAEARSILRKQEKMLEDASEPLQKSGDLDGLQALNALRQSIEENLKNLDDGIPLPAIVKPDSFPQSELIQNAFDFREAAQAALEKKLAGAGEALFREQIQALDQLVKSATIGGNLDEAVALKKKRDAVQDELRDFQVDPKRLLAFHHPIVEFPKEKNISAFHPDEAKQLQGIIAAMGASTQQIRLPSGATWTEAGVLNREGTLLLTGAGKQDGKMRLYNLAERRVLGEMPHQAGITDTAFHPTLPMLFAALNTPTIAVWDAVSFQKHGEYTPLPGCNIVRIAFDKQGNGLAGTDAGRIILWNALTGEKIREFANEHTKAIRDLVVHPNGRTFTSASDDGSVRLWNVDQSESVCVIPNAAKRELFCVRFYPDGSKIAVTGKWDDPFTSVYDTKTGELRANYGGYGKPIRSVNFSPDGRFIITGDVDCGVVIWDVSTKEPVWSDRRNSGNHIYRVLFTPKQDAVVVISGFGPVVFEMPRKIAIER